MTSAASMLCAPRAAPPPRVRRARTTRLGDAAHRACARCADDAPRRRVCGRSSPHGRVLHSRTLCMAARRVDGARARFG
eukprot:5259778-Prymnesium_polylepis.1